MAQSECRQGEGKVPVEKKEEEEEDKEEEKEEEEKEEEEEQKAWSETFHNTQFKINDYTK